MDETGRIRTKPEFLPRSWQGLASALEEEGCFGFLKPVAAQAVDAALKLCPAASSLVDERARADLQELCVKRLRAVYERPLLQLAIRRLGRLRAHVPDAGNDESRVAAMRQAACDLRNEVASDGGASLRNRLPLAAGYERAIAGNFAKAVAEFLNRLMQSKGEVSRELLDEAPITRVLGISADGADPHRHGRLVMRIATDAGEFYYKPHDCRLDALYLELVRAWLPDGARAARLVRGDGYAFVERLVPETLRGEGELRAYWHNFGQLAALFHGLGSRDMTVDNIMCCGTRPAVLDLETLLVGEMPLDERMIAGDPMLEGLSAKALADSVVRASVLPLPENGGRFSPLASDNASGTCLPRVDGKPRTVRGYEQDFAAGFEEGYRHLVQHRGEVLEMLRQQADAPCRLILLNTWAYAKARGLLFSPGAMSDPEKRDEVLAKLNAAYGAFSEELREQAAVSDAAALMEGDIPYYYAQAGSRAVHAEDGRALGDHLAQSALEVAASRLARLSETELRFELDLIRKCLDADAAKGGRA